MTSQSALWGGPHLPPSSLHPACTLGQGGQEGSWCPAARFSPGEILLDGSGAVHQTAFTQGLLHSFKGTYFSHMMDAMSEALGLAKNPAPPAMILTPGILNPRWPALASNRGY